MIYRARKSQLSYGRPIGILALEEHIPCPPGTPGNPTTFAHPVCYEIVPGTSTADLVRPHGPEAAHPFIRAGEALVRRGAGAVIGNCGLMIVHQAALARALPVPVFMSSLLQLPLLAQAVGPAARIGVIASSRRNFRPEHLKLAGLADESPVVVATMDGRRHFEAAVVEETGTLDFDAVEAEVVEVALSLVAGAPGIRAILFECVDLPPYAAAVQQAVGLPVFDITTLVSHVVSAVARRPFAGVY